MSNVVGEAAVRVRPDTRGFAQETKRSVTSQVAKIGAITGVGFGVAEVVKQLRAAVDVERDRQIIAAQANTALRAAGKSWDEYGSHIDDVIQKQSKLSAFDDEDLLKSFTLLFRATKDVNQALDLNALASDVARGRNMDLLRTAQLLVRVQAGQVGSLRRLGIQVAKNATGEQALAKVREQYAGSAITFANSQLGAQARLNKVWNDSQEIIGGALAPAIAEYSSKIAEWLNNANESGETQRRVNEVMETATGVVHGVVDALGLIRDIGEPVVNALGGIEDATKLAILAFAGFKVAKFIAAVTSAASSFGLIAASSRRTTAKVVADAAIAEAALDAAYRPRSVIVTPGGGVPGGGGTILGPDGKPLPPSGKNAPTTKPSRGTRLGKFVRKIPVVGGAVASVLSQPALAALAGVGVGTATAAAIEAVALLATPGSEGTGGDEKKYPFVQAFLNRLDAGIKPTQAELAAFVPFKGKTVANMKASDLRSLNNRLAAADAKRRNVQPGARPEEGRASRDAQAGRARTSTTKTTGTPRVTRPRRLTFKQVEGRIGTFEEQQLDAQLAKSVPRERQVLLNEQKFLEAQIADKKRSVEQRRQLKAKLQQVDGDLDRINESIARDRESAAQAQAQSADKAFGTRVSSRLGALERQRREAAAKDDLQGQAKALAQEEAFLKKLISQTKAGSDRREQLSDELTRVHERQAAVNKKVTKAVQPSKDDIAKWTKELAGAGTSTAAHITAIIRGTTPKPPTTSTASGASTGTRAGGTSTSGDVATVSVDQTLRDIANGQAQRDRLQLDATNESNRLLRILVPGQQTPPRQPRGRTPGAGLGPARDTADITGGLP